jgi:hypothetical protein
MLGPSGKPFLFFEHEPTVLLVTLRFLLEKLLNRNSAIPCGQFARIEIRRADPEPTPVGTARGTTWFMLTIKTSFLTRVSRNHPG